MYEVRTPDNTVIHYQRIEKEAFDEMLTTISNEKLPDDKLDFARKPAFKLADGRILYIYGPGKFAHLYDNEEEYLKAVKGEKYFKCSFFYDEQKNVYAGFFLKPSSTPEFYQKPHHIDEAYPDQDRENLNPEAWSRAYFFEDGTVCYLMDRTKDFKQGTWFSDRRNFEYYYNVVFR